MSRKWTDQQKTLHWIKTIGGATVLQALIPFISKWGIDRVVKLCENINSIGIDNAINILNISNELGPEATKTTLLNALANKNNKVIPLKKGA